MAELGLVFNPSTLQLCRPPKPILPLDPIDAQSKTRLNTFLPQTHSFPFPISESVITISLIIQGGNLGIFLRTAFFFFPAFYL